MLIAVVNKFILFGIRTYILSLYII